MDRSEVMRRVKGRDTKPEMRVRMALRALGAPGYRLHRKDLPGRPDIAFVGRRRAIFVHGCVWHGHHCKRGARPPRNNADYWRAKIERNRARDAAAVEALVGDGWRVLVVWECGLKREGVLTQALKALLGSHGAVLIDLGEDGFHTVDRRRD